MDISKRIIRYVLLPLFLFVGACNAKEHNDARVLKVMQTHLQMKVVIKMLGRETSSIFISNHDETTVFYIRTAYNSSKDIILTNYINGNQILSFKEAFVGDKNLSDEELMANTFLVSRHTDSTAPLLYADTYWHIYGQHGCPMPRIENYVGMTSVDVGAEWKDQLDRHYKIGYVDEDCIYLVPVVYQDSKGHCVRDWKNSVYSDIITDLIHISGGVCTTTISSIENYGQVQLRPVMSCNTRKWFADGKEIIEPGTYYCNEFKVSETAIGYDPATITNWFGGVGKNVDLTGSLPMAEFTFDYNYKGAQCCVNTTINILREVECNSYGATQQQFFFDNGDYKAMFMIPKAKERNGVEIDKPFNSPDRSSPEYTIYRTDTHLKDVDDPVDRQIGYLYNPDTGDYLVGMAAGLSLVSGETVKSKRIQNCPIGGTNFHWMLLYFSPSNTNKFYVAAINTAPFADNDYYLPVGYTKEINYYVSYFDPSENVGQVYWYKDGDDYIIYAHCQEEHNNLSINVPDFMEGATLSVVEKTNDTELLSENIQDGKFFVNYNTAEANYIVLVAAKSPGTDSGLVTITAKDYIREYGDTNPVFDYKAEGAGLDGEPEIICDAIETSSVGTYDILVKQGSVKNYNVEYVGGTLTITKAPLNIAAGIYTKKQGEKMPELTLSYTGFKNDESKEVLSKLPEVTCDADEDSEPGEYPVFVSGAEAQNYDINYTNGKLVILEAEPVKITAKSYKREYGETNPVFEYTTEGADLDGEPEIICEATPTSTVGFYDIVVQQGTVKNYKVEYVAGRLTVTKAPLKVSVGNYSREEGQENPVFTLLYEGWKNDENEDVLEKKPSATTDATKESPVGDYVIKISGGEALNYKFEYVDGLLTVVEQSGINDVILDGKPFDVYSLTGLKVRIRVTSLNGLSKGIYIIDKSLLIVK